MKKLLFIATFLCFAVTLSAQNMMGGWGRQGSRVEYKTMTSQVLGTERNYTIYLPAGYDKDTDKSYPILYLLHGMNDNNKGWYERGHLKDVMDQLTASGEVEEMIIVTPDAGGEVMKDTWQGYFDMPGWSYEKFFYEEFMPMIEKEYRVKADKAHRGIAGLSMGGGGCTSYAERHSDLYCACYAMSALMHLNNGMGGGQQRAPQGQGAPQADQKPNKTQLLFEAVNRLSCVDYVNNATDEQVKGLQSVAWYVDCGDDDFLFDCNMSFIKALRSKRVSYQLRVRDGAHTWEYWHSALYNALPFFSRQFNK
ncbi:MAG: esterase family protein [Alistipes sp.]|nr:esterase family protein [Alistipes sp.]